MAFQIIPEPLVTVIASYFTGYNFTEVADNSVLYFVCAGFSLAYYLLSVRVVTFRRKKENAIISPRRYGLLLLFVAICIFMGYAELITILRSEVGLSLMHIFLEFCVCSMPVLIFFVFERFQEHAFEQTRTKILQAQLEQNEKQFELMEIHQLEIRKMKHDFNGQLAIIREMAQRDNNAEALEYLDQFSDDITPVLETSVIGFSSTDALIAYKKCSSIEKNIDFEFISTPLEKLEINPVHLNNILVNALDNAIEACQALEKNRYIKLTLKTECGYLFINITNSSPPVNLENGKFPETTKADKSSHGIGLESIRQSSEKYKGLMNFECNGSEFRLLIRLRNCASFAATTVR
ncbi:MAG: GHKL domain-containing protein [Oscillospiraceae bacterium]|nr:GHKL domain-containing protein [Oscillospiraceae bacterium]